MTPYLWKLVQNLCCWNVKQVYRIHKYSLVGQFPLLCCNYFTRCGICQYQHRFSETRNIKFYFYLCWLKYYDVFATQEKMFIRMLDFTQIRSNYANETYANELICKLRAVSEQCVVTAFIWHLIFENLFSRSFSKVQIEVHS